MTSNQIDRGNNRNSSAAIMQAVRDALDAPDAQVARADGDATAALSRVSVFAIPPVTVDRVARQLVAHGRIPRGYLGVGLQPIALPEHLIKQLNRPAGTALIVISVGAETPAGKAGIVIGDVLLELGGRVTQVPEHVHELLDSQSIGAKLKARILRGGKAMDLELTVGERPSKE